MRFFLSALVLVMLVVPAHAAFEGPGASAPGMGGFQGPTSGTRADTVKKALQCWDDAPVILTGHIVSRRVGSHDKYLFRDATGEIIADIDDRIFAGRTVTPETRVRISGEVDRDRHKPTQIDVKFLEILQ